MDTNAETKTDPGPAGLPDLADREHHTDRAGVSSSPQSVTPIPASIVKAICEIKATLEAVKKSQRNSHGGYNFSSTDDIYAALTRKMGQVGLLCLSLEDESEVRRMENKKGETVQWLRVVYSFVLATSSDTWTDPRARRTLLVQVTGPQTFQAAQSFAEKAYLRSLFKIPSGDMDLDAMPQGDTEEEQSNLSGPKKARKSSAEGKRDGSVKRFNELRLAIQAASNSEDLNHLRMSHMGEDGSDWHDMPSAWRDVLDEDWQSRRDDISAREAA